MNTLDEGLNEIKEWLKSVSFKRARFGGVDEADVWKKINELNGLYEKVLIAAMAQKTDGSAQNTGTPGLSNLLEANDELPTEEAE